MVTFAKTLGGVEERLLVVVVVAWVGYRRCGKFWGGGLLENDQARQDTARPNPLLSNLI